MGIDTSVWHYDPIKQKNALRSDFVSYDADSAKAGRNDNFMVNG